MSVLVLAHLLFLDSIRLSAFSACISQGFSIRFIHSRGLVSDIKNGPLSPFPSDGWNFLTFLLKERRSYLTNSPEDL